MLRSAFGAAALTLFAGVATADFIGIDVREDKDTAAARAATGVGDLRVFNLFATFDAPGGAAPNINNILNLTTDFSIAAAFPGASFYQAPTGNADVPPNAAFLPAFPELEYDSFVTLRDKINSPAGLSLDNDWNTAGNGFRADGRSVLGGWFNSSPPNLLGAANAQGDVLLAQFSIAGLSPDAQVGENVGFDTGAGAWLFATDIFEGTMVLFRQGNTGQGETPAVPLFVEFTPIPTPGALALFGVAGLAGVRRRRA